MGDPSHKDHLSEEDVAQDIQGLSVCNFNDVQSGRDSSITSVEADALSTSPQGNRDGSPSGGLAKYGVIESETLKHLPSNGNKNKQKTKDDGLNKDIAKAATIKVSGLYGYFQKNFIDEGILTGAYLIEPCSLCS